MLALKKEKKKPTWANLLNPVYSLNLTTREILELHSIKKLNSQPI
jgi:putative heme degradation protein